VNKTHCCYWCNGPFTFGQKLKADGLGKQYSSMDFVILIDAMQTTLDAICNGYYPVSFIKAHDLEGMTVGVNL
jgi:hypothetical protein